MIDTRALDAAVRCYQRRWKRFIAITTGAVIGPIDEETIALICRAYHRIVKEGASHALRRNTRIA